MADISRGPSPSRWHDTVCAAGCRVKLGPRRPHQEHGSGHTDPGFLRCSTVVVDQSAQNRECLDRTRCLRWGCQLRVRIGDPVQRLRRSGSIVVLHELLADTQDVSRAHKDEVVERFLT